MQRKLENYYFNLITKNKNYNEDKIEKIRYTITSIIISLEKFILIFIMSIFLDITTEFILLITFTKPLRFFSFGFHARSSIECLILSTLLFIFLPYILLHSDVLIGYKYIIFIASIINFYLFSPSDTKKRPLNNRKKRIKRKIYTLLLAFIYFLLTFIVDNYLANILILSIIITIILTNPIIYLITKEPYRNYLINRKEVL